MTRLRLDPALRIGARRGQLLAWLPAQPKPRVIAAQAVERLGAFLASPDDLHAVSQHDLRDWREAGLLVEASGPPPGVAGVELPAALGSISDLPSHVRLAPNVSLQPGEHDFLAWSSSHRAYFRLPATLAVRLLQAGEGRALRELLPGLEPGSLDEARARAALGQLLAAGLLHAAAAPRPQSARPASPIEAEAVHLGQGDPWAGLKPDGRRPIYFVTHHADHLPLALGMLRAHLMAHDGGELLKHYQPLPIVSTGADGMQSLYRRFGPGLWLFSNYMWSHEYNRGLSAAVKAADPKNLTIHGGPSAPKYEEACHRYMLANPHVDVVVRGEGEATLVELLQALAKGQGIEALGEVPGLTFQTGRGPTHRLVRTSERHRLAAMDELPSPYLSGMFNHYGGKVVAAILESNRGCPYACTFCDWGSATQQKIRSFDLERVKAEIDWIGQQRIRVLWIADANFGIFKRDVEIAEHVAATKAKYGYPREVVVNYPKNATEKIAEIVKIFARAGICSQGIISIQTTDPDTLAVIRRDNIKTKKYDELGDIFRRENLPLSTDLMIGLPGATVKSFKGDLQYYFDDDVGVKAYRTQLLPNAPMSDPDYLRENDIQVDAQQYLVSTSSYSTADLGEMMELWSAFDIADGYAVLRYVARFLQWEHGIAATDFIHALVRTVRDRPAAYPAITWLLRHFHTERQALGGWGPFYAEIADFAANELSVPMDPGFATTLRVNELMMPEEGRRFPEGHALEHDFEAWFQANVRSRTRTERRLADYPPGRLEITDPYRMCDADFRRIEQYDNHQVFFELASSTSRRRSVPNFVEQRA